MFKLRFKCRILFLYQNFNYYLFNYCLFKYSVVYLSITYSSIIFKFKACVYFWKTNKQLGFYIDRTKILNSTHKFWNVNSKWILIKWNYLVSIASGDDLKKFLRSHLSPYKPKVYFHVCKKYGKAYKVPKQTLS